MVPHLHRLGLATICSPDQLECQPTLPVSLGRCSSALPRRAMVLARGSPGCRHSEERELTRWCCTLREFQFPEFVALAASLRGVPVIFLDSVQRLSVGDSPRHFDQGSPPAHYLRARKARQSTHRHRSIGFRSFTKSRTLATPNELRRGKGRENKSAHVGLQSLATRDGRTNWLHEIEPRSIADVRQSRTTSKILTRHSIEYHVAKI